MVHASENIYVLQIINKRTIDFRKFNMCIVIMKGVCDVSISKSSKPGFVTKI